MNGYTTMRIGTALDAPASKRAYTERLFSQVAPRYDCVSRLLSFGRDAAWKRELVGRLPALNAPRCMDLACGTGDLAALLRERYPDGAITAIDLVEPMLARARTRLAGQRIAFVRGDLGRLEAANGTLDVVTGGYALRNAPDLNVLLREVASVLRPGGVAAFLEFSRPDAAWRAWLNDKLLRVWGGFWGIVFHGDPHVYGYIAESLSRYPSRSELHRRFREAGFQMIAAHTRFLGFTEIVFATVEPARSINPQPIHPPPSTTSSS